ncbi:MAG: hypothetical protein MUP36_03895 [Demequinaceae bacterium]|nr:hypothetical protein [Demequinaceae bacterium]
MSGACRTTRFRATTGWLAKHSSTAFRFRQDRHITRLEGTLLVVTFVTYITYLLVTSL